VNISNFSFSITTIGFHVGMCGKVFICLYYCVIQCIPSFLYTAFHKIGTPLFSLYKFKMSVNFNENYNIVFAANFSCCYGVFLTELQDLGHAARAGVHTRPKSRTSTRYENALRTNGISWISASKPLESDKRDYSLCGCMRTV